MDEGFSFTVCNMYFTIIYAACHMQYKCFYCNVIALKVFIFLSIEIIIMYIQ